MENYWNFYEINYKRKKMLWENASSTEIMEIYLHAALQISHLQGTPRKRRALQVLLCPSPKFLLRELFSGALQPSWPS